jgi:purine-binding chemotaxis protein CheW
MDASSARSMANTRQARQILTFHLGEEIFGVDILRVKEIRGWSRVTRMPLSPPQVLGVLNLRGAIVPIIDLRLRFTLATAAFTSATVVIVISIATGESSKECGLVVDAVSDVVDLDQEALRAAPQVLESASAPYIECLAALGDRMLILLDVDELVRGDLEPAAAQDVAA